MIILKIFYQLYSYVAIIPYRFVAQFLSKRFTWRTQITDRIYLGGFYFFPWDFSYLKRNNITAVVNLCSEFPSYNFIFKRLGIKYFYIPTTDICGVNKKEYLEFLKYFQSSDKKVLVNCAMGQSRSASFVWKLLCDEFNYSDLDAEKYIADKRKISISEKQKKALM